MVKFVIVIVPETVNIAVELGLKIIRLEENK